MDYTKFGSREMRLAILKFLRFVPDNLMIRLQYKIATGNWLNLKEPKRYTEKLQWYKLFYRNPLMVQCADKFDVREYVTRCGLGDILTKCYGVFDSPEEIDFSSLPEKFVAKDTLGGGGTSVLIVRDKCKADLSEIKNQMRRWVNEPQGVKTGGREWPYYSGKKHRIVIEEYIETEAIQGLTDYKFFCFDGRFEYMYLICDRELGQQVKLGIFDKTWNKLEAYRTDEKPLKGEFWLPEQINEMVEIAEKLSKEFPHARVDLYNENGKILFGEITFFDGSGYMKFEPDEFDFVMGEKFKLPEKSGRKK